MTNKEKYQPTAKAQAFLDKVEKGKYNRGIVRGLQKYIDGKVPEEMQGVSLKPVFENDGAAPENWRNATYYHYYEYPSWHSVKRHYGIRTENYKLIHFYNDIDEWELYDMKKDPQEMENIYNYPENATLVLELKEELQRQQSLYKDTDPDEVAHEFFSEAGSH